MLQSRSVKWLSVMLMLLISVLAACGADADPILPTPRPTLTATSTATATPVRVLNATATDQPPPTATDPGGPSPTPLIGATSTYSALSSLTPTLQSTTSGSLSIEYFTTDAQAVRPGDSLTLFWSVKGADSAIIYRLNADGSHDQLWQVDSAGKLAVKTRATDTDTARFSLSAGDNVSRIEKSLSVPLSCPQQSWFFTPAPASCPADAPLYSPAAQQNFERGQMIWLGNQGRIYVLFNDGKKPAWGDYADTFKDGQPDHDPALSAPPNLIQPIRGFGLIWRTQAHVRDRLGWATGSEVGFDGAYQSDNIVLPDTTLYLRARDKAILQLASGGADWKLITPSK